MTWITCKCMLSGKVIDVVGFLSIETRGYKTTWASHRSFLPAVTLAKSQWCKRPTMFGSERTKLATEGPAMFQILVWSNITTNDIVLQTPNIVNWILAVKFPDSQNPVWKCQVLLEHSCPCGCMMGTTSCYQRTMVGVSGHLTSIQQLSNKLLKCCLARQQLLPRPKLYHRCSHHQQYQSSNLAWKWRSRVLSQIMFLWQLAKAHPRRNVYMYESNQWYIQPSVMIRSKLQDCPRSVGMVNRSSFRSTLHSCSVLNPFSYIASELSISKKISWVLPASLVSFTSVSSLILFAVLVVTRVSGLSSSLPDFDWSRFGGARGVGKILSCWKVTWAWDSTCRCLLFGGG